MNELNYIAGLIKKHRYIIAVILFIPGFIFWVKPRISFMNEELYGLHAFRQCDTAAIARNFTRYGMNNKNIYKDKIRYLIYSGDFEEIDSEIFNKIIENKEITKQGKTATGAEYLIYDFSYKNDSHVNEEQLNILFKKKDKCSIKEIDYDFGEAKLTGYSIRILPDSVIELITSWDLLKSVDPQARLKISLLKDKYVIQDWSFYFNKGLSPVSIQKISSSHCFVHHLKLSEAAPDGLYEMQINIETAHKSGVCIKTIELPVLLNIMKSNKEDIE